MKRYALLLLILAAGLLSDARLFASTSTATTIEEPDLVCTTPVCGALYVQSQTLGVSVTNPTGALLLLGTADLVGNGLIEIRQNGRDSQYGGANSSVPIQAWQLQSAAGSIPLNPGTTIPGPDFTSDQSGGATHSAIKIVTNTGGPYLDWTGGMGAPVMGGTQSTDGVLMTITSVNGNGAAINIADNGVGGTVRLPHPYISLGFLETATFIFRAGEWDFWSRGSDYFFAGGSEGGGRVTQTTNATPKFLMRWQKNGTYTPGIAFTGDVAANVAGGGATGYWQGVKCGWDAVNVQTTPLVVTTASGNNAGAVPTGWGLSCTDDAQYHNLNVIGVAATTINWRANNFFELAPPF